MNKTILLLLPALLPSLKTAAQTPMVPRFSIEYMDRSVDPGTDFYHFADGDWVKNNPVPADKSRWGSFSELQERNWSLIHGILDSTATNQAAAKSPAGEVGGFYKSAMDTNRLNELGFKPIEDGADHRSAGLLQQFLGPP